jgi:hypothetical protein
VRLQQIPRGAMGNSETSHEKFRRLAEKRVVRTIKDIRLIGNLSNRSNYRYERAEVDKIFRVLEREMKQARARFESEGDEDQIDFKL